MGLIKSSREIIGGPRSKKFKKGPKGEAGYDNLRKVIDPNIVTKNIATKEATVGGYTLPSSDGTANQVMETDGSGTLSWTSIVAAGEANTASNTGSAGTGLHKQKTGVDLEFYKLNAGNNQITVALDGTDKIDLTIVEANINHDNLTGFVANEHLDWTSDQGANNIDVNNITAVPEGAVTAHEAALDHDALTNFVANEHIDWTGASNNIDTSGTVSGASMFLSGDRSVSGAALVPMMVFGTDETPPTASNFPQGSFYIQYTP